MRIHLLDGNWTKEFPIYCSSWLASHVLMSMLCLWWCFAFLFSFAEKVELFGEKGCRSIVVWVWLRPVSCWVWLQLAMPMVLQSTIPFPDSVEMGKNHLCISVLQSYGIKIVSLHKPCSAQILGTDSLGGDIQSCKLCGHSENIANMLLCDRCEEAFHVSCCKPRVVLPIDEWFCPPCLKMSQNSSFIKSPSIGSGIGSCKFELGPIAVMLKYPEPYTSKVRLGEAFQAQVPEWCDQINVYVFIQFGFFIYKLLILKKSLSKFIQTLWHS